jgi:hypothetical protein
MASLAPPSPKPPVGLLKTEPTVQQRYSHALEILARLAKREAKR